MPGRTRPGQRRAVAEALSRKVRAQSGKDAKFSVDARLSKGFQVGDYNTQINYMFREYDERTWSDGVAPPPLASVRGEVESPYRGLRAFRERDAAFFFGREQAATTLLVKMSRCLQGAGMLIVSGASGAGKSSLLWAGVLPRIRGTGLANAPEARSWPSLVFTPTRAPLDGLAAGVAPIIGADAATVRRSLNADPVGFALTARQAALARSTGTEEDPAPRPWRQRRSSQHPCQQRLLLVVDQFEQLFTQCADEEQRRAFITALHAAATAKHGPDQTPAALVVLGVRADFEAGCAEYPQLVDAIQNRYLVTSMTERQLRLAITGPAKKADSSVDDDLTDVLLREIHTGQPGVLGAGVLPLLSHALDQAWRARTGRTLTLADYERTGGIEGAVAESAQRAYDRLTPAQQNAARQVFTRLTATSSDGVDTANRATKFELWMGKNAAEIQDVEAVLEAFTAERLLTLAADSVEISHEVLLTAWPLLRDTWLYETQADRKVRTRLQNTAADWARHSHDPSYLYSGSVLQTASETASRISADRARYPPLSQIERDFLQASDRARRRRKRAGQALLAVLTTLVIGFALVAAQAVRAGRQAAHQRNVAVSGQLSSESELLGDANPDISKLLSVAAWRLNPSNDARYAMLAAAARPGIAVLYGHAGQVSSVAFSPDGRILASAYSYATLRLWDVATHRQIGRPLTGHTNTVTAVAFGPDGKVLASGSDDETVRLWDVATQQQIGRPLIGHTGYVSSVAFSPDGKVLASGSEDGTVRLWDVANHQQMGTSLTSHTGHIDSVAFSPDGKVLASGSDDGTVRLWDVATHQQIGRPLTGSTGPLSVAFSPDGKVVAGGSFDGTVRLWDVSTHQQLGTPLSNQAGEVFSVAFSQDGKVLASGNADGTVWLWDVATHQQFGGPLTGRAGIVNSVAFSPDGKVLASGNADGTVRLWNVASGEIGGPLVGHSGYIDSVAFSPDGKKLASASFDGTVRLWDVVTHQQLGTPLSGHAGEVSSVAFSPDGKILASGNDNGTVWLWDVSTHQQLGPPLTSDGAVLSVAFSPGGKTLASGGADGTVRLWDVATRQQIGAPLTVLQAFTPGFSSVIVSSLAFSPRGNILASGYLDGTVRLWDVATHEQLGARLLGQTYIIYSVAFSPDGKILATGSLDDTVRLWDVATHQQIGAPLTGHTGYVDSVAFSPDGEILASGSEDKTLRLWDVATHQQIGAPLTGHTGAVRSVVFSPDGRTLATGSFDDTVRFWNVTYLTAIVPHLCASVGRSLTRAEWARYVSAGPAYQVICP